jgi:hypothetical protein
MDPWEIIKTIGPWAFRKSLSIFFKISNRGLYGVIHEFQGSRPIFQPPHMKDMMDAKDGNYKLDGHTTHEPIEINEKSIAIKFGTNCDNLHTNKVYTILGYMNNPKPYMLQLVVSIS